MPGARPTMRSRASRDPNEGTGALNQPGSRARRPSRKVTRRGQRGQSRGGSTAAMVSLAIQSSDRLFFVVEVLAGTARGGRCTGRRSGAALQELRRVLAALVAAFRPLARSALGRIAADLRLQLDEVDEDVGLPAQLVGDHR